MKITTKILIALLIFILGASITYTLLEIIHIPIDSITPIALVIVTVAYAFFTYLLYKTQEKNTKILSKPLISANPYFISPGIMFIQIANMGNGPAINVNVKCKTEPPSSECRWNTNFYPPKSDPIIFQLAEVHSQQIVKNYSKIIIETEYYDLDGKRGEPNIIEIETSKIKDTFGVLYRPDFHTQMENVTKELHEITKNTRGLDKVEKKLDKLDDIEKNLKRLNDINKTLAKNDKVDKGLNKINKEIVAVEKSIRGLGPIIEKNKKDIK